MDPLHKIKISSGQLRSTLELFIDILNAYAFDKSAEQLRDDVYPGHPSRPYVLEKHFMLLRNPAQFWGQLDSLHQSRFFHALISFAISHSEEWKTFLVHTIDFETALADLINFVKSEED